MGQPTAVLTGEGTIPIKRDLQNELAATMSRWFEVRREKKTADKTFNDDLKELEERAEELIGELKAGGTQLTMHFGTIGGGTAPIEEPPDDDLETEPGDDDNDDEEAGNDSDSDALDSGI